MFPMWYSQPYVEADRAASTGNTALDTILTFAREFVDIRRELNYNPSDQAASQQIDVAKLATATAGKLTPIILLIAFAAIAFFALRKRT